MNINKKLLNIVQEFNDEAWYDFHGGNINDQDDFYEYLHQWIDNQVIYHYDCEEILKQNMDYCFDEHDVYGRAEDASQAAYCVVYDCIMEDDDTVTWGEMQDVLDNE